MNNSISPFRLWLEGLFQRLGLGMRAKLIGLFVIIKVLPLVLLAVLAWSQSSKLGDELRRRTVEISDKANQALGEVGRIAVNDAKNALDARATEDLERMSTDTALQVANFLYDRDEDIRQAAMLKPGTVVYERYLQSQKRRIIKPGDWELDAEGRQWVRLGTRPQAREVTSTSEENQHGFRYRPPDSFEYEHRPLYLEMTFVNPDGMELYKAVSSPLMDPRLKDVSDRRNTFVKAETYFEALKKLRPGEIYVSDVIGEYVGSRVIGTYTPESAAKAGEEFAPEKSAYAGRENPLGRKFKGLVRWATPVVEDGRITGYVTLALDHDHLMEFTSHLMPTSERYTEIPDASQGNYAFIWDHKGRSIVHPRHFSITGYDAATGDPQIPWLEDRIYDEWQASGLSYADFITDVPTFDAQSNDKKPSRELLQQGLVGLDCRYLNFAVQCTGWFDLTEDGGSGSFQILWSGLLKVNTAAAIPYYTGQYGASRRGFGFVAIGAGLEDFHSPANATEEVIKTLIGQTDEELRQMTAETHQGIGRNLLETAWGLMISTGLMVVLVILIAIWIASAFTRNITNLINGISRFRSGERHFRFNTPIKDEIGALADSFDEMAESIVSNTQGSLVITNLDKKILYINEEGMHLMNKSWDEVIGTSYFDSSMFPANSRYNPIESLEQGREPEVYHHLPSGRHYKGTASYLTNNRNEAIGYIISTSDVSDIILRQNKIEEQRSMLDTIFTSSPDLIWYKDSAEAYLAVNPRFASIIGKKTRDILGRTPPELFSSDFASDDRSKDLRAFDTGLPVYSEENIIFADGHMEHLDAVRTPIYNAAGQAVGILGVARDVTSRVNVEKELRQTQIDLEKAALEANKANESKSAFLARMSHEIRTPMNAIIGMTNIIKKKLTSPQLALEEIQAHVLQIEVSSNHLLGLLNDILDISKIEAGKIELAEEPFDFMRMLDSVDSIIRPRCLEKKITYDVDVRGLDRTHFTSDSLRLRQVLINLLGNSVKFTPECGHIRFTISRLEKDNGRSLLSFSVADNGIGMSDEVLKNLFTPFEQGNQNITQKYGGTGLGLSISRSIVQLLGGDIQVTSDEGQGSEFSFALWMKETDAACEEIAVISSPGSYDGKRALLVDDVEINRIIVVEQLSDTGILVEEADDGLKALEKFASSPEQYYDLILMDVQMPNMDGYSAAKAIRALPRADARSVPIIAMTANAFKEDVEKALSHGMNGHLAKPLEHDKFMDILARFLS